MVEEDNEMSSILKCVYFLAIITILIGLILAIIAMFVIIKPKMLHDYRYEDLRYLKE